MLRKVAFMPDRNLPSVVTVYRNLHGRSHRLFIRVIIIEAVVIGTLVGFASYAFASAHNIGNRPATLLNQMASHSLTMERMKATVLEQNLTVYWIGGDENTLFSIRSTNPSVPILSYLEPGKANDLWGAKLFSLTTYLSDSAFAGSSFGPASAIANSTMIDSRGDEVITNINHPAQAVIKIKETGQTVVMDYLEPQDLEFLISNAEKLVLLKISGWAYKTDGDA
jgi:hypothetical protein